MKAKKERSKLLRLTEEQHNRIKGLAKIYAGGNTTLWMTWAALNTPRRYITAADLKPKKRRSRKSSVHVK